MLTPETFRPILKPSAAHLGVFAAFALAIIGLQAIDTAPTPSWLGAVSSKQALWLAVSAVAMIVCSIPHFRHVSNLAYPIAIVTLLLLIILLLPFMPHSVVPVKNGARRWIDLKLTLLQPSEFAKIVFVIAVARYLRFRSNYRSLTGLMIPLLVAFIPMGLILVEPDLGTALVFLPVLFAMLLAAGARLLHLLIIIATGLTLVTTVLVVELVVYPDQPILLKPHQKARINAMAAEVKGETTHRKAEGFQGYVATTLIGAGQSRGYGKHDANEILRFNALPETHNDMIFSVICARWGFLGGAIVLTLFLLLIFSGILVAAATTDPFGRLIIVGFVATIFTQLFVNIGMTMGLLPITGMTLPLVSYGGSSLVANFLMLGLMLNVASRQRQIILRPAFEFSGAKA